MADRGERGEQRRHVEVGVVEHDRRRLAAQFEEDSLARLAGRGHDRPPVGVEPVKVTMSTSGLVVSTTPTCGVGTRLSTLTTPAGMSVWSAISSPSASVISGVSGAPFSTTVQPAASAGASLARAS